MIETLVYQSGYLGLFFVSFVAATLVPLSSEMFVITMVITGYEPVLVLSVATFGNTLGALANYFVGKYGSDFIFSRYIELDPGVRVEIERKYQKWGSPILVLAWAPIIGDPLTVVAGGFRVNLYVFSFWVTLGKALRYGLLIVTARTL